jgi:antitoxin component of MazEF toxin-antitoxin module
MIIKGLTKTGNSQAILLDKAILQAAHLGDNALFAISVNPNGGITIQSVEDTDAGAKQKAFQTIVEKNNALLKRLSDR